MIRLTAVRRLLLTNSCLIILSKILFYSKRSISHTYSIICLRAHMFKVVFTCKVGLYKFSWGSFCSHFHSPPVISIILNRTYACIAWVYTITQTHWFMAVFHWSWGSRLPLIFLPPFILCSASYLDSHLSYSFYLCCCSQFNPSVIVFTCHMS